MSYEILIPAGIIGLLGLCFGCGLAYASRKFAVKVDERVVLVREVLPGANCAACGQTGCDAFAQAVVDGSCAASGCPVGGKETEQKICDIMGLECGADSVPMTARVMCGGSRSKSRQKFLYSGIEDCTAASNLYGGPLACSYGCVGMGDCVRACRFDAIVIEDGLARMIEHKCTGCEMCVKACPKKIIDMVPKTLMFSVRCSSLDKGNIVRKNCDVGCIGCRKCAKVCPSDAIDFKGTLAHIIPEKCTNCGECYKVCPTSAIQLYSCHGSYSTDYAQH